MASSIIGSSMVIDGEVGGDEDLIVQGTVRGRLSSGRTLIIEAGAVVEAEIRAKAVEIAVAPMPLPLGRRCRPIGHVGRHENASSSLAAPSARREEAD